MRIAGVKTVGKDYVFAQPGERNLDRFERMGSMVETFDEQHTRTEWKHDLV